MSRKRQLDVAVVVVIFVLGLGLRLGHHAQSEINIPLRADAASYFQAAANLYRFGVYSRDPPPARGVAPERRTQLQPGYPLVLSAIITTTQDRQEIIHRVVLLQTLLGALLPVLVFALSRFALPTLPSAAAALASALSPHLIALEIFVLTDALFSFLLTASLLLFVIARHRTQIGVALAAGFVLGLASLVRQVATPLPFLLAPLLLLGVRGREMTGPGARRKSAAALLLGFGLVWVPQQAAMGLHAADHPVETVNSPWLLFAHGAIVDLVHETDPRERPWDFDRISTDIAYGAGVLQKRFLEAPAEHLAWFLGGKALFMWRWENLYTGSVYQYPMIREGFEQNAIYRGLLATMRALHWPLHGLALSSLVLLVGDARRGRKSGLGEIAAPMSIVIAFNVALLSLFMPVPRYSIPLRPFVYVLAAGGLWRGVEWARNRRRR